MKVVGFTEPVSEELLIHVARNRGIDLSRYQNKDGKYKHPQEDYFAISKKYPIFVVADGVSLDHKNEDSYPNPSGAGMAARLFCEAFLEEAEKIYESFGEGDILKAFRAGNLAVGDYNKKEGRIQGEINYFDFDLFAATAAGAVIKNDRIFWFSLCDSAVTILDKNGENILQSPNGWTIMKAHWTKEHEALKGIERRQAVRRIFRNGLNKDGELIGYGVVTGEATAEKYLNVGKVGLTDGLKILIYTDGFEDYMKLPEFREIIASNTDREHMNISEFTRKKAKEDSIAFGHERSLIIVNL